MKSSTYDGELKLSNFRQLKLAASGFLAVAGIILFLLLLTGLSVYQSEPPSHPKDAELEAIFHRHEADFNRLLEMSRADSKVVRIAPGFTWLEDNAGWPRPESELGFSTQRWDEYRRLFKQLEVRQGILQDAKGGITYFMASGIGLVTSGSMKGYAYSQNDLSPVLDSLDDYDAMPAGKRVFFKRVKGDWYLFYMRG